MTLTYKAVQLILVPFLKLFWRWRIIDLHKIPAEGPVIIAANHISYFDPLCHALCVNESGRIMRVFAKSELWKNRLLRAILKGAQMIPVDRGSGDAGPIAAAEGVLREGGLVMLYPESTLSKRPDLLPMQGKTGVARVALSTGAPVVPVAVWGSHWVVPPGAKFIKGIRKLIILKVGEPMRFDDLVGRQDDPDVRRDVTDRVMKELELLVRDIQDLHPRGAEVPERR